MLRVVPGSTTAITTIHSPVLGRLELDPAEFLEFAEPIAGFADCVRYVLMPYELAGRTDPSMCWLQAVDAPYHTFLVTDPWSAVADYHPEIADTDVHELRADAFSDTVVLGILTVSRTHHELTINLQAPLLINTATRLAKQVLILNSETYTTRHRVCELP